MPKYKVTYAVHVLREIEINAETPEAAADFVRSGKAGNNDVVETDVGLCDVTRVEVIKQ